MKKYILILSALTTLLSACSKKNCCTPPQMPFISAEKNNTPWTGDPGSSNLQQDSTIAIFGTNFSTQLEETLTIQFKATTPGKYPVKGRQALYYNTIGRDVRVSEYELDDTFPNIVEITTYNKSTNSVAGTFNLKFKHSYPPNTRDNLQFLNGKFKVSFHN